MYILLWGGCQGHFFEEKWRDRVPVSHVIAEPHGANVGHPPDKQSPDVGHPSNAKRNVKLQSDGRNALGTTNQVQGLDVTTTLTPLPRGKVFALDIPFYRTRPIAETEPQYPRVLNQMLIA